MTTIRPPATPPAQLNQARAAFFRPAAPQGAPQPAPVARQASTALTPAAPTPTPTAAVRTAQAAPERPLRPGSIIDIRV
jgi:hypothetical protein